MARLKEIEGHKIALDSVIFIYALEGNPEFGDRALKILEAIEQGRCQGFACDLVLAELMVKPLRMGETEIAEEYASELPKFPNLNFRSVTRSIVTAAARLRGSSNLGLIDALHLATAAAAGCTIFITNDAAMRHSSPGLDIWMLRDIED
ncbi:MAG: type II toxin-antitoxin system VapC family toxin [Cyanobacteriota bacterium]|nr:type II toxin-antitoxin system VapC family toxin [Cyanobacteriota bacterium]